MHVNVNFVCMTKWTPRLEDEDKPLYVALADAIERDVYTGMLSPGSKLPTHRDLADELAVNVSTITRGYSEAERRGLVASTVGRGTFVAVDATTSTSMVTFEPQAPGLIEMGLASPMPFLEPDLGVVLKQLARRKNPDVFLRYSDPRGIAEHREVGACIAGRYGMSATVDDIVVTAGSQHALSCTLSSLFSPGDRIATDSLTYPGLKALASSLGIRLCPVVMDQEGMVPESLDMVCRQRKVKGVYLLPHLHNPTSCALSAKRKEAIAAVAEAHRLIVIEDDVYAFLHENELSPVSSLLPEQSVFIAGVSKMIGAGLRVGFVRVPKGMREAFFQSVLNSMWMVPPLNVEIVAKWFVDGELERVVECKRNEAKKRVALARSILTTGTLHTQPSSFFGWWELPEPWTGQQFELVAKRSGVNVFGAEKFIVGDAHAPRAVRVSLTGTEDIEELEKGLRILQRVLM